MTIRQRVSEFDHRLYGAVERSGPYPFDVAISWLASAANHSRLSLAAAGLVAAFGGPKGRRAAAVGVLAVTATSVVANLVVKNFVRRPRPQRKPGHYAEHPQARGHVPMPTTPSFPSGHAAAAASLATAMAVEWPAISPPFIVLAALIGYSRVHTGVHYPLDVLGGITVGVGFGLASAGVVNTVQLAARERAEARLS